MNPTIHHPCKGSPVNLVSTQKISTVISRTVDNDDSKQRLENRRSEHKTKTGETNKMKVRELIEELQNTTRQDVLATSDSEDFFNVEK